MNICFLSHQFPPETGWGGIGSYTYDIAQGLSKMGHIIHVISRGLGKESTYQLGNNIAVHRILPKPSPWLSKLDRIKGGWRIRKFAPFDHLSYAMGVSEKLQEMEKQVKLDIVESAEYYAESYYHARLKHRTPLIIRFHTGTAMGYRMDRMRRTIRTKWACWLEKQAIHRADFYSAPSKAMSEIAADDFHLSASRIRAIANPIDEVVFHPDNTAFIQNERCVILFVGLMRYLKGVHVIARAIPKVLKHFGNLGNRILFRFVGKDTDNAPDGGSMREYTLSTSGANGCIEFIGHVSRDQIIKYYQTAYVLLIPSLWENFPYTALEALACGTPVIGSCVGGIPEIIEDGKTGILVPIGDPDALVDAIIRLISIPEHRDQMARAARKSIETRFGLNVVCSQMESFYNECLSRFHDTY